MTLNRWALRPHSGVSQAGNFSKSENTKIEDTGVSQAGNFSKSKNTKNEDILKN